MIQRGEFHFDAGQFDAFSQIIAKNRTTAYEDFFIVHGGGTVDISKKVTTTAGISIKAEGSEETDITGSRFDDFMYAADGNHVVLRGGGGKDTINLEMLYNSGKAAAFGDAGNDKLVGLFDYEYPNPLSNLSLHGGAGRDVFEGYAGLMEGGSGDDVFYGVAPRIDGGEGFDTLYASYGILETFVNIERFVLAGEEYIETRFLAAVESISIAYAGSGRPGYYFIGGEEFDLSEAVSPGKGIVVSAWSEDTVGLSGVLTIRDDRFIGGKFVDTIDGADGNDELFGGGGADRLSGGSGNDSLSDQNGSQLSGGDGNDRLEVGGGGNSLFGDAGDDGLISFQGSNLLFGGEGNDRLHAGKGNDTLTGGIGADAFISAYSLSSNIGTVVTDFDILQDILVFRTDSVGFLGREFGVGALEGRHFQASSSSVAANKDVRIIYDTDDGRLYYDLDGNGTQSGSHLVMELSGAPQLTATMIFIYDFFLL